MFGFNFNKKKAIPQEEIAKNGFDALSEKIGKEEIKKARKILSEYKSAKGNLETKIIENEQWYKIRHWECMRDKKQEVQPSSAWLFNCIANKHADAMDNFPSPNILPREEADKEEAKKLSSIIPVVLDQCEFEQTYSDVWNYKLKQGTGVYGVFWDKSLLNGLGDITIKKIDILNLFWEPGITDIQQSHNVFNVELVDNETLKANYPQLVNELTGQGKTIDVKEYICDENISTKDKSVVVDWYYRKIGEDGKVKLHYCKFVNDVVLFATENTQGYENGIYDHGKYPFVFDVLYPIEGTPAGFGYIDIGKDCQAYIDRGNQAIMKNLLANCAPRYFVRLEGSVNEEEYANQQNTFVHVNDSTLGEDSIRPIEGKPLNSIYVDVIARKIDELKETTGNRDISTGGTTSGVTAASAIAAMQEAGSKLSRDSSKGAYRAYRKVILLVIELIRQFYNTQRCFRILGDDGNADFVRYKNDGIAPQEQGGVEFGIEVGLRLPLFDIEVTAQKQSPYSKMAQNELALQFYNGGFFNPQMADQALACLDMMDFDRKQFMINKISQNSLLYSQLMNAQQKALGLAQMIDGASGSNYTEQLLAEFSGQQLPIAQVGEKPDLDVTNTESAQTRKARERVAESTSPV